ncbi:MAG: DMT family transporter, partial [Ruminococcus sp.]|nr:DMT family transporter [Ruminococcus sp.]
MNTHRKNALIFLGAFVCCFLWGSAFPGIKIGYSLWGISGDDTWQIIRFAGIRFFLAGALVIAFASLMRRRLLLPEKNELGKIAFLSLFQTVGQYILFYLGLAHTTGVNSAVVDSLTSFFAIIVASLFMKMEQLTPRKIAGCVLGFAGVLLINLSAEGFSFRPLGDGMVALSALCYGISSSLIKKYSANHDTVLFSGYQFMMGGVAMTIVGQAGTAL